MSKKLFLVVLFFSMTARADGLYTDTWVNWTPIGKVYDVVCFSKKNGDKILKDIRVLQMNRKSFQYRDATTESESKVVSSKECYFEQKDPHPVSRDEFFEEIVSVKCSLNALPFKDGDFRILGTNVITTSVKRLRDGKVWILPTNDCTFTTQLARKQMVPAQITAPPMTMPPPQAPVAINPELSDYTLPQPTTKAQGSDSEPIGVPKKTDRSDVKETEVPTKEPSPTPRPQVDPSGGTIKQLIRSLN